MQGIPSEEYALIHDPQNNRWDVEMKIGIALGTVRPERWTEITCEVDRLGYESVWMPEHLVLPVASDGSPYAGAEHPPIPSNVPVFDSSHICPSSQAAPNKSGLEHTSTTSGCAIPFRLARAVATLDIVSGGRAEFGDRGKLARGRMGRGRSGLRQPGQAGRRGDLRLPEACGPKP